MPRLFKRGVELLAIDTKEENFKIRETVTNTIKITGLRVGFTIEKQLSKDPNTCELIITNLSEDTRSFLQKNPLKVKLSAGYGDDLVQIFVGDKGWDESMRLQTGWETKLRLGDGERAFRNARVSKSYIGGTQVKQIVKDVADSMGLSIPKNVDDAKELASNLVSGTAVSGPSHRQLTEMLKAKGMKWSVQDDQLVILKDSEVRPNEARIISAATGMIGTPGFAAPTNKGDPPVLSISSLLYPEIVPGGKIDVQSKTAQGIFRVERVRHTGDTHGEAWHTEIEAKPV